MGAVSKWGCTDLLFTKLKAIKNVQWSQNVRAATGLSEFDVENELLTSLCRGFELLVIAGRRSRSQQRRSCHVLVSLKLTTSIVVLK